MMESPTWLESASFSFYIFMCVKLKAQRSNVTLWVIYFHVASNSLQGEWLLNSFHTKAFAALSQITLIGAFRAAAQLGRRQDCKLTWQQNHLVQNKKIMNWIALITQSEFGSSFRFKEKSALLF